MSLTGLRNTIILEPEALGEGYDEKRASVLVYPGMLLEDSSYTQVRPHTVRGGAHGGMVAWEDGLGGLNTSEGGGTIDDSYAIGKLVRFSKPPKGARVQYKLKAGENISVGDFLISYGDGTLCKAAAAFLANNVADSDATAAGTTEAVFSNGTVTVPKNTLKVGDTIRIRATVFVADQNSTDTLTLRLKIGSTTIIATAAVDVADNDVGVIDATLVIRTIGASGTFVATGAQALGVPGTVTMKPFQLASTAIDTTVAQSITVTAQWSASHADNDALLRSLLVEHVKAGTSGISTGGVGAIVAKAYEASDLSGETEDGWVKAMVY